MVGRQITLRLTDRFVLADDDAASLENASVRAAGTSSSTIVTPERIGVRMPAAGVTTRLNILLPSTRVFARIGIDTVFTVSPGANVIAPLRAV